MPTDARTTNRNYPKPHPDNRVSDEVARLIDTLDAIDSDVDSALDQVAGKAAATHSHPISDVTGLQGALDNKAALGHTHTLDELSDVNVAGASNGQFLQRIAGNWQPAFLGNLDASVITTGTLDPARIPVLTGQAPIVSSGAISALTVPQQAQIITGTIVVTTDGFRWVYSGSGSKTDQASYISLADVTPEWAVIANKPATFAPSAHNHPISDITGLQAALDAKLSTAGGVVGSTLINADGTLEIGRQGTGDRVAYVDFHASGVPGALDYSARIIRNAGINGSLEILNNGTGGVTVAGSPIVTGASLGAWMGNLGAGSIGNYGFMRADTSANPSDVRSGSTLRWSDHSAHSSGATVTGSWLLLGHVIASGHVTLCQRIA